MRKRCEEVPDAAVTSRGRAVHARRLLAWLSDHRTFRRDHPHLHDQRTTGVERSTLGLLARWGCGEKVFLVDGPQDPDTLSQVAQAFFVWNDDVQKYFSNPIPLDVNGRRGPQPPRLKPHVRQ